MTLILRAKSPADLLAAVPVAGGGGAAATHEVEWDGGGDARHTRPRSV